MPNNLKPEDLLGDGKPITKEYEPTHSFYGWYTPIAKRRPAFTSITVEAMLADPRVTFGLQLIKGPILANAKFLVQCEDPNTKEFIIRQISRFWRTSCSIALSSVEYGYAGCEVIYRELQGKIHFDHLKYLHPNDIGCVIKDGEFVGMEIKHANKNGERVDKPLYMSAPKAFWTVHSRELHPWYGRSRLFGAYIPWHEMWTEGGQRDIRFLWFYKHAFSGGTIYYPIGSNQDTDGNMVSNKNSARQLLDVAKAGASLAFPVYPGGTEQAQWKHDPAKMPAAPEGMLEYGEALREEIFEGMGIPPEVAYSEGTGAFAGRKIPQQAFYTGLYDATQNLMTDFDNIILSSLISIGGFSKDYEIETLGLMREEEQADGEGFEEAQGEGHTEDMGQQAQGFNKDRNKFKNRNNHPSHSNGQQARSYAE
jgi:hypothetical protein